MNILLAAAITEPAPVVEIIFGAILVITGIGIGFYNRKKGKK